ncbi:MAG: phosphate-starvation-inducible PsiE family protein [Deltaproteobacteria bacterium]|nr:phosphate-starvation-inducible PsiE family protein [Deltaproteobacteria bacterium]MBI3753296.1 phosphate-starvation-inducible PsiE family protein [Deltaproteobacteria bacterium]
MVGYLQKFEQLVVKLLTLVMSFVLILLFVDLVWVIVRDVVSHSLFYLTPADIHEIFGHFLLVLIGIELLESIIKTYLTQSLFHVEVVLLVAIIAVARKVIIMEVSESQPLAVIGIGVLVLALSVGYYLLKQKD